MAGAWQKPLETILSVIAVCCAVVVTTRSLHQAPVQGAIAAPQRLPDLTIGPDDWDAILATGGRVGPAAATLQLAVFTDLECPYCRQFANDYWPRLQTKYGTGIALIVVHLPIMGHPFARQAARALECAGEQERYAQYFRAVTVHSAPLTDRALEQIADSAHVPQPTRFRDCLASQRPVRAIVAGEALATQLGITGTPAFVINGKVAIRGLPTFERLDSALSTTRLD